jgi:hypothetical protein
MMMNTSLHRVVLVAASLIESSTFRILYLEKRQTKERAGSIKIFHISIFQTQES